MSRTSRYHLLFFADTFLFVFCLTITCHAQNNSLCVPSSCGNIHKVSFPFRLKGDPEHCGKPDFELDCRNNHAILNLSSKAYYVQAITYDNFSIRLLDPGLENQTGNCTSLPLYRTDYDSIPARVFDNLLDNVPLVFISCLAQVNSSRYVPTAFCRVSRNNSVSNSFLAHDYIAVGSDLFVSDFAESCSVETVAYASARGPVIRDNTSLSVIKEGLAYGFELNWFRVSCGECEATHGFCSLQNGKISCKRYCYEDVPLSELGFHCTLQFWGPIGLMIGSMAIGGLVALKCLCGWPLLIALVVHKWKKRHFSVYESIEDFLQQQNNLAPIRYNYYEIKKMTNNLKEKLGEGAYGSVFKGKLRSGPLVAVKVMGKTMASGEEFISEVATIGRIHHVNVVQLIGFCVEGPKRALVYEFMPNGSLDKYTFQEDEKRPSMSYKQMYEISLGVARGIDYLHRGCDMQILHFDIKPHNILLGENFNPKISDFGLAKLYPTNDSIVTLTAARGTMGYMAPELFYKNIGGISYKADVYSFGMLLMETVGRRKPMNPFEEHLSQVFFPTWVYDLFHEGKDIEMGKATNEERIMVKKIILVALWCIQMKPADRPSMNKVVEMLEGDVKLIQMPPRPFLAPREIAEEDIKYTSARSVTLSGDGADFIS